MWTLTCVWFCHTCVVATHQVLLIHKCTMCLHTVTTPVFFKFAIPVVAYNIVLLIQQHLCSKRHVHTSCFANVHLLAHLALYIVCCVNCHYQSVLLHQLSRVNLTNVLTHGAHTWSEWSCTHTWSANPTHACCTCVKHLFVCHTKCSSLQRVLPIPETDIDTHVCVVVKLWYQM